MTKTIKASRRLQSSALRTLKVLKLAASTFAPSSAYTQYTLSASRNSLPSKTSKAAKLFQRFDCFRILPLYRFLEHLANA